MFSLGGLGFSILWMGSMVHMEVIHIKCIVIVSFVWLQVMTVMIYIFFDTAPPQPAKFIRHGPILNYAHVRVCFWVFFMFYQHTISYGVLLGYILMQAVQIIFDEA